MTEPTAELVTIIRQSALFDEAWYLARYPDVGRLGMDPAAHYLWLGARLGRDPSPRFDTSAYLDAYPDVAAAGVNPLVHFELHGRSEGRSEGLAKAAPDRFDPL